MATQPVSHQMDVYGAWLHIATTRGQWKQIKKTYDLDLGKVNSIGRTEKHVNRKTGQLAFCVFINVGAQSQHDLLDTCAHEAVHVGGWMLDHISTRYDGNSEPLAYLVGWLTAFLWDSCK